MGDLGHPAGQRQVSLSLSLSHTHTHTHTNPSLSVHSTAKLREVVEEMVLEGGMEATQPAKVLLARDNR